VISSKAQNSKGAKRPGKFGDLVFTRQFSAFDRQNPAAANTPFHGFYTLFWLAVFLFMVKIAAENWKAHGTPLGTNEIMKTMFRRDGEPCAALPTSWYEICLMLMLSSSGCALGF
jgi:sterol O-acyltransferase